ncbi:MAG: tannase/feruloyl esterase family alpha/beta hydrolase [Acidobacteria bacterium]|nr:tannase/feruloyl esterase family alpha/beta hydrolase [Acidobacteriota bacterium]
MKFNRLFAFSVFCLALCVTSQFGQAQTLPAFLPPAAGEVALSPKTACADLRALTGYEFTIESATLVTPNADAPGYCRIRGLIQPEIQFEVSLPAEWNRRFYMFGNGGYAGESLESAQRAGQRLSGLRRGFVVAQTNTGHDAATEPLGTFAVSRQKLLDYAFRSLHTTAETGKRLAAAYYGARPAQSYFEGCSTGGRQALILAQRFPDDFDGIVAGAPVLYFSGTMVGYAKMAQAFAAAPIPYTKLKPLAERIYALCDEKDGLQDGLIDDPRRCDFRPSRDLPKCAEGADNNDCFTSAQIGTLEKVYGDVMSNGQRFFPGWPVSAEITGSNGRSGWDNWIVNERGQSTISVAFGESFFRYLAFPEKNPKYELTSFDFDKDVKRLGWIHGVLDATDADLSGFKKRGGKLLMYFGWADPALNAQMGVDYYESVLKQMGATTPEFFRLFMVPGMFHCGGGVGCSNFDKLTPLMQWVERGTAPDRLIGSRITNGKTDRTRPLCPYPQVAKYKGSGSTDDAANFTCQKP